MRGVTLNRFPTSKKLANVINSLALGETSYLHIYQANTHKTQRIVHKGEFLRRQTCRRVLGLLVDRLSSEDRWSRTVTSPRSSTHSESSPATQKLSSSYESSFSTAWAINRFQKMRRVRKNNGVAQRARRASLSLTAKTSGSSTRRWVGIIQSGQDA